MSSYRKTEQHDRLKSSCVSPLFWTQPSFTTFWSFMLALRSEFKGQGWKSPKTYFLFVVVVCSSLARLTPFSSPLTFSATLWCNVSASLHFHSLSGPFKHSSGESAWKETTNTHTDHSLPLLPLRRTHTSMRNKVIVWSGETFPTPSGGPSLPPSRWMLRVWQRGPETTKTRQPFRWAPSLESEAFHL